MFNKTLKTKVAKVRKNKAKVRVDIAKTIYQVEKKSYRKAQKEEALTFFASVMRRAKQVLVIGAVLFVAQGIIKGKIDNNDGANFVIHAEAHEIMEAVDRFIAPDPCELKEVTCGEVKKEGIEGMIHEAFGDEGNIAVAVAKAESGLNPNAKGDTHIEFIQDGKVMGHSCGLFQIRVLPGRPDCETLKDPKTNIEYAKQLHDKSGWRPWSAFKNGSYLKHLK